MQPTHLARRDRAKLTALGTATVFLLSWATPLAAVERAAAAGTVQPAAAASAPRSVSLIEMDHRALVSRSDLIYRSPPTQSWEGQPVGNGVMGTSVWTTPGAVHLQINRCDVFAVNKKHREGAQFGATDYCGACAQVSLDVGGEVFLPAHGFQQRLSIYEAGVAIHTRQLDVRCFVAADRDVLVLEIDDRRPEPKPLSVTLGHWRPAVVKTGGHTASWEFAAGAQRPLLVQRFVEGEYLCASAVAVQVVGCDRPDIRRQDRCQTLTVPARAGATRVLVASAAAHGGGFDGVRHDSGAGAASVRGATVWPPPTESSLKETSHAAAKQCHTRGSCPRILPHTVDVAGRACELLDRAAPLPWNELQRAHLAWWREFWSRTWLHVAGPDAVAGFFERVRNLHLYLMASTSRGTWPAKWNGGLFTTEGDTRAWGSQFWVWTTEIGYWPLYAADAIELTQPLFEMYLRQLPDCRLAARQRWGVGGAFYPETTPFDGPLVLPEDAAREFRDVYLGVKQNSQLSSAARQWGQFDCSLRVFVGPEKLAAGRYTWISHVCSSGAELAVQAWWRYRYTGDVQWLRSHAYPLLREVAEFYRQMVFKGDDGRYHLRGTNVHEDFWGVTDGIMDLAAIRGAVPLAVRAAAILDVDPEQRALWQDLLKNLTPYPMGSDPQAKALTGAVLADDVWAAGRRGPVDGQHNPEDVWLNPVFPFEDWTLATQHPATDRIVHKTLDLAPRHAAVLRGAKLNTAIRTPIAEVRAGRGADLARLLASYYAAFSPLSNGLSLFEGAHAQSVEHLGLLTTTLQEAAIQSVSPRPGEPEVIHLFPAWPKAWDATYRLLARGGFLVTAAIEKGQIVLVELASRRGETCRLRNPWNKPVRIEEFGEAGRRLAVQERKGPVLTFETRPGCLYRVVIEGVAYAPRRVSPPAASEPASYQAGLPGGAVARGVLGRN